MKPLTVAGLIKFLQTQPQNLTVVYGLHSENALLTTDKISVKKLDAVRADGWVADAQPGKPTRPYLVFPGN